MNIGFNSGLPQLGNPKVTRRKFGTFALLFMLLFGAVFAGAGLLVRSSLTIDPSWARTTGTIVNASSSISDGSTMYAGIIEYTVDGREYQITTGSSSSSYPAIGSKRTVAYNPSQPANAKDADDAFGKIFTYVFMATGLLILVLGPVFFVRSLKRSRAIANLLQTGTKMQGVITDVREDGSGRTSNGSYCIVVSAADTTGTVREYVSDSLTGLGGIAMVDFRTHPVPMDVYVNPTNPNEYYVDLADAPSLTPDRIKELIQKGFDQEDTAEPTGEQPPAHSKPPQSIPPEPPTNTPKQD